MQSLSKKWSLGKILQKGNSEWKTCKDQSGNRKFSRKDSRKINMSLIEYH